MREFEGRVTDAPCRTGRSGKLGNVARRINVGVQPCSAQASKTMFYSLSKFPAHATSLRRVSGVDVNHGQSSTVSLVGNKVLELAEGPPMQPRPDPLPCPDVGADVGQIFHANFTRIGTDGFCNDGLASFVVDVFHMPLLTTGDSAELAFSSPATVGLETTTMGKVDVPVMPEFSAAPDLAGTGGCEVVLTHVKPENTTTGNGSDIGKVEDKVEIPNALADDQLGFFGCATGKQVALVLATDKRNLGAPVEGEQRERITLDRVGTFVEVDRCGVELNGRNRFVLDDAFVGLERLVGISNTVNRLANHLTTKRGKLFAHGVVGQVMQSYAVPAAMLNGKRNDGVAGSGIGIGKRSQCRRLFGRRNQLERYRSHRHIGNNTTAETEMQLQNRLPTSPCLKAGVSRRH